MLNFCILEKPGEFILVEDPDYRKCDQDFLEITGKLENLYFCVLGGKINHEQRRIDDLRWESENGFIKNINPKKIEGNLSAFIFRRLDTIDPNNYYEIFFSSNKRTVEKHIEQSPQEVDLYINEEIFKNELDAFDCFTYYFLDENDF